jgi:hypothetical protein
MRARSLQALRDLQFLSGFIGIPGAVRTFCTQKCQPRAVAVGGRGAAGFLFILFSNVSAQADFAMNVC